VSVERVPVVVVGAGPVGVVTAILLAQRGVRTVVLEQHAQAYPLPRAVHLDDEVAWILREIGLAAQFAAISRPMPGMRLVDSQQRTMAEFRRDAELGPLGCPQASMFDQPDLERVLVTALMTHPCVELRRGCTVTSVEHEGEGALVRYSDGAGAHVVGAQAVLGCDGANSVVRGLVAGSMRDLRFEERWVVIDVRTSTPLAVWGGVHQICDPRRPGTFMQVTGTRYRWEFRLDDGEQAADLTSTRALTDLLRPWFGPTLPADVEIVRRAEYTFRAQVAGRWRSGRVFLLGDAAHQMPPFIGQGLGAGLRDAHNLVWKLAGVLRGELLDPILDTYERERRPHAIRTVRAAVAVGWALTGGQDRAAALRRALLAALCRTPGFSRAVLSTTSPPLGRSPLVRAGRGRRVGRLAPGVPADPGCPRPFTVIGGRPADPRQSARLQRLGVRYAVEPGRRGLVLIRPDGVVGAVRIGPGALPQLLDVVQSVST
jgi:3-(3-hydroxy-phenyl)propionate hydroxylase